jgi:hypothetical protein
MTPEYARQHAEKILEAAHDHEIEAVVEATNVLGLKKRANLASVTVGCLQVLAQDIANAPEEIRLEMHGAVIWLLGAYVMQYLDLKR